MEFKITKEFIIEAHSAACSTWKSKIESEFPDLFKKNFEVGKWYYNERYDTVIHLTELKYGNVFNGYGFNKDKKWFSTEDFGSIYAESCHHLATHEEIEKALIDEAKRRGFVKWGNVKLKTIYGGIFTPSYVDGKFYYYNNTLTLDGAVIFKDGKWSEIIPEEKTVITKEKALKILAKKYKTTPENIEIQ